MRIGHCLLTVLVLLFNAGCGTIVHTPKDYELDDPWPTVKTSRPVAVRGGNAAAGRFTIDLPGRSMTVDLREYTEALVQRVRAALANQGVAVEPGAITTTDGRRFEAFTDGTASSATTEPDTHNGTAKTPRPQRDRQDHH